MAEPVDNSRRSAIGILAYGSLKADPGVEIHPLVIDRIETLTPFPVEYARPSATRGGAPTVVPYSIGHQVKAKVLILTEAVSLTEAHNLLWRRETRNEHSEKFYRESPKPNAVVVRDLFDFGGVAHVLYTDFNPQGKITDPEPKSLARVTIESVGRAQAGKDGISYLGSSRDRVGNFCSFFDQIRGGIHVRIFKRRYSSSRSPYARRWMTRILLFKPSAKGGSHPCWEELAS